MFAFNFKYFFISDANICIFFDLNKYFFKYMLLFCGFYTKFKKQCTITIEIINKDFCNKIKNFII